MLNLMNLTLLMIIKKKTENKYSNTIIIKMFECLYELILMCCDACDYDASDEIILDGTCLCVCCCTVYRMIN